MDRKCNRCKNTLPLEKFEGFVLCNECRAAKRTIFNRHYKRLRSRGQRLARFTQEEREHIKGSFKGCAFCEKEENVVISRLIKSGGEDLWNMIPVCVSCNLSRQIVSDWVEWYKGRTDIYSSKRFNRIVNWHNEKKLEDI